jgi:hypothetical protein
VRVLTFGILLAAFEASAQRISIPDFSGRGAGAVRTQLVNQLCDTAECVAATKVTVGGKPDMKKAKREQLQYFVTGIVGKAKKGKGTQLELTVVPVKGGAKVKRVFPLEKNGALAAHTLDAAVELVRGAIGPAEAAPQPTPIAEPVAEPTPTPTPYRSPSTTTEPSEPTEPSVAERTPEPTPAATPTATRKSTYKPIIFALEIGTDILNRQLAYADATTNNVRQYDLAAFPLPTLKLEFYPLAFARTDILSGLGLEGSFGIAPFLKSRRQTATDTLEVYPTTAMKLDVGLRWRIVVSPTFPLAITPYVGFRLQSFSVGTLDNGDGTTTRLDGLPNIAFVGMKLGVALEVPVVNNLLYLVGRFGILPIFSSGEIISANFFLAGSTFGFEANAGLAVQPLKFLQIRATFEYTQYGLTFQTQDGEPYVAAGATDRYLGGNLAVRLQF